MGRESLTEAADKSKSMSASKIAGIVSAVLWIVGFALAFVVPSTSPFMWVPDALLLIGFFPLLIFLEAELAMAGFRSFERCDRFCPACSDLFACRNSDY